MISLILRKGIVIFPKIFIVSLLMLGMIGCYPTASNNKNNSTSSRAGSSNFTVIDNPTPPQTGPHDIVVSTFAGSGVAGFEDNVIGTLAKFNRIGDAVIDSIGNLYVADCGNNKIRKITSGGEVSTFAGTGAAGYLDADALSSTFNAPDDLAVDSIGNVYVADGGNKRIRKISGGMVSSIATLIGSLKGVNVDFSDNVYFTDTSNGTIVKMTSGGISSVFCFSGSLQGGTFDSSGNGYFTNPGANKIVKITSDGNIFPLAGSGVFGSADGTVMEASFSNPFCVAIDTSGNVYVADIRSNKIRKISNGVVSTLAGSGVAGSTDGTVSSNGVANPGAASFNNPNAIAIDLSGNLYVTDLGNNKIRKITM